MTIYHNALALFVRYLVPAKVWGHEVSFVLDFSGVCDYFGEGYLPLSFWTLHRWAFCSLVAYFWAIRTMVWYFNHYQPSVVRPLYMSCLVGGFCANTSVFVQIHTLVHVVFDFYIHIKI